MIEVRRDKLGWLREGMTNTLVLEARPRPGDELVLFSPAKYRTVDGQRVRVEKRMTVYVLVQHAERYNKVWRASVKVNAAREQGRYLSAQMGSSDYVTNPAMGAEGEPECVSGPELERQAKDGRDMERLRMDYDRTRTIRQLEDMIRDLQSDPTISVDAARYVRRLKLNVQDLRAKLRAA